MTFFTGAAEPVRWTFARQLLTDGVERSVGEGDVRVWPAHTDGDPVVYIALSSPSGRALFEAHLADVVDFLSRSYLAVPTGSESDFVDVTAELGALLSDEARTPAEMTCSSKRSSPASRALEASDNSWAICEAFSPWCS